MFDQLLETEPKGAEVKNRKGYFIISSIALFSILFTALIVSLFAVDLNLDMNDIDMVELVAPIDTTEQKLPETEIAPKQPKTQGGSSQMATRQFAMARIDESPRTVPSTVSTAKNSVKERLENFKVGNFDSDAPASSGSGRGNGTGSGDGDGLGDETVAAVESAVDAPPPPVRKDPVVKEKPVVLSMGVVNSRAVSLPKPTIPATAKAGNAAGTVSVHVLIDEKGNVVSANAVSGNILLRASSEAAARNAQFTPTLLSGSPIKISGVINYHFNSGSAE